MKSLFRDKRNNPNDINAYRRYNAARALKYF